MRHGERYPTKGLGTNVIKLLNRIKEKKLVAAGDLSFLNNYQSPALNPENFGKETTMGPYNGYASMFRFGGELRKWYGHLWNGVSKLPFFTASPERIVVTAQNVARGFIGDDWEKKSAIVVIPETPAQGLNTLTPDVGCPKFTSTGLEFRSLEYLSKALAGTIKRIEQDVPGLNITPFELHDFMSLCFYELNAIGESPICGYFNENEWKAFENTRDLVYYYYIGPGNPMSLAVSSLIANASLTLFTENNPSNSTSLYMNFAHEINILEYMNGFGIGLPDTSINWENPDFHFRISQLVPMGARLHLERLVCTDQHKKIPQRYIRFIINGAVYPYPNCSSGPGFSCPFNQYVKIQKNRMLNPAKECGYTTNSTAPSSLTFYWDWAQGKYANNNITYSLFNRL